MIIYLGMDFLNGFFNESGGGLSGFIVVNVIDKVVDEGNVFYRMYYFWVKLYFK